MASGVYTPWLRGYIPLRLGGVYPWGSGVYTLEARGCIPFRLGGVHPPAARFYTEVAFVVIQPHYRSPKSRSLVQNRHEAESISSHKRGISANMERSTRKRPRFHPIFGQVGQIASLAHLCQFACRNAAVRRITHANRQLRRGTLAAPLYNLQKR